MSYAYAKTDANQAEIVRALIHIGCTVHVVNRAPFDVVVGRLGANYLLEIKDSAKTLSQQKLKPSQERFSQEWRGQWACVNTAEAAIKIVTGK